MAAASSSSRRLFRRFTSATISASTARITSTGTIGDDPDEVAATTARRFGHRPDVLHGRPAQLVDHLGSLRDRGVERFYLWCTDFAPSHTLEVLGTEVLPHLR